MRGRNEVSPPNSGPTQRTSPLPCAPTLPVPPRPKMRAPPQSPAMRLKPPVPNSTPRPKQAAKVGPQMHPTLAQAAAPAPSKEPKTTMGPEHETFPTPTRRPSEPADTPADTPCAPQPPSTLEPPSGGRYAKLPEQRHIPPKTKVTAPAPLTW